MTEVGSIRAVLTVILHTATTIVVVIMAVTMPGTAVVEAIINPREKETAEPVPHHLT